MGYIETGSHKAAMKQQSGAGEKLSPAYNRETQSLLRHFQNLDDGSRVLTLEFIKLLERKRAK
jgi:hypothetical protein